MEKDQLEELFSDISSELSVWHSLIANEGWKRLMTVATGQINARAGGLKTPIAGVDAAFAQEFLKGEIVGIELFQSLPQVEVERLQAERERIEQEIENVTRTADEIRADGRSDGRDGRDILERDGFGEHS